MGRCLPGCQGSASNGSSIVALAMFSGIGRGPQENYPDRKSATGSENISSTVKEMYEPYLIPQDYGLRTDNTVGQDNR